MKRSAVKELVDRKYPRYPVQRFRSRAQEKLIRATLQIFLLTRPWEDGVKTIGQ